MATTTSLTQKYQFGKHTLDIIEKADCLKINVTCTTKLSPMPGELKSTAIKVINALEKRYHLVSDNLGQAMGNLQEIGGSRTNITNKKLTMKITFPTIHGSLNEGELKALKSSFKNPKIHF